MQQKKKKSKSLFNDQLMMIVGSLLIGIAFPLIFGMRPANPDFLKWIIISVLVTFSSWLGARSFGKRVWDRFPWSENPWIHVTIVFSYILVFTAVIIVLIYVVNVLIGEDTTNYWVTNKIFHWTILGVFVFSVTVHEVIFLFFMWKQELTRSADLEKENIRSQFEALKNHVNPHFLFNSLGTLSSLINANQEKATQYVNEFSKIYRYFLDVNSNDWVSLNEELEFINSYIFLQKIRYGNGFTFEVRIDKQYRSSYILPLTLQLLVENALKHNIVENEHPLKIEIFFDNFEEVLVIRNNLQMRKSELAVGTGLTNLEERYKKFVGQAISYSHDDYSFTIKIPLIFNKA